MKKIIFAILTAAAGAFCAFALADGKRIIFTSERDGEKQVIYSMKADGTDVKRLLKTNSFYARFSPDGKRIAFISGKFPENNIFIADADGSNVIKLTK